MTPAWTPRPRNLEEPSCWSWPVPPLETIEQRTARLAAENAGLPIDLQRDPRVLRFISPAGDRFGRFHAERCALCGQPGMGALVLDHCHATGQVRGWLCAWCNVSEGRSSAPILSRYRAVHPAYILGYYEMYAGRGWQDGWQYGSGAAGPRPATPWEAVDLVSLESAR